MTWSRLALDAKKLVPDVEDQVIALPISQRLVYADSELDGGVNDGRLRYCTLLVGRQHD